MTLYVDSSALVKRLVEEPDSEVAERLLASDPDLVTGRHTTVEVRRNLARLLEGRALREARLGFEEDLRALAIVELDEVTCQLAASIAETTGARTLDALHLGAARRVGQIGLLTFDFRQAQIARAIGFTVFGS